MTQYNFTVDQGLSLNDANITATTPNNTAAINFVGNSSGDGSGYTTIQIVPDETLTGNDQYLIIDPTGGGHIHIRAGGAQDNSPASLFLGGENSYVQIPTGLNPNVLISANSSVWTFGTAGELTFPNGANIVDGAFNGTASSTVSLNAFSPDGNIVSIQAQGNASSAVISVFANSGPVTNNWVFTHAALDPTEPYFYVPGGAAITTPNATGNIAGKAIFIEAGAADQSDFYTSAGGDLYLKGGRGAFNDGGGGGPGGDVNINAGESADPAGVAGNVYITAGALQNWVFDNTGNLTAPGNIIASTVKTTPVTFSALPSASAAGVGARAFITDATTTTFAAAAVGGGGFYVPVFSNGTGWYIG